MKARRANLRIAFTILFVGLVLFVSILAIVAHPEYFNLGDSRNLNVNNPQINVNETDDSESENNIPDVETLSEALNDLETENCLIINTTKVTGYEDGLGFSVEYSELRKLALKQSVVFLVTEYEEIGFFFLLIPYEKSFVVWAPELMKPEITSNIEELEIQSIESTKVSKGWIIELTVLNEGQTDGLISDVYVNDDLIPESGYGSRGFGINYFEVNSGEIGTSVLSSGLIIRSERTSTIKVYISKYYIGINSGSVVSIKLESSNEKIYTALIQLG